MAQDIRLVLVHGICCICYRISPAEYCCLLKSSESEKEKAIIPLITVLRVEDTLGDSGSKQKLVTRYEPDTCIGMTHSLPAYPSFPVDKPSI